MLDNDPKKTTLQGRLSQIIRDNCRSKKDFAERIDISADTIKTWDDAHFPKGDTLEKIHRVFRVDINWLLTGRGEPYLKQDVSAAENQGLYGVTEEKEVEGVLHAVTVFEPKTAPSAGEPSTTELLVRMLAQKDEEIAALRKELKRLALHLDRIKATMAKYATEPSMERRAVMKEIADMLDGNELLERR